MLYRVKWYDDWLDDWAPSSNVDYSSDGEFAVITNISCVEEYIEKTGLDLTSNSLIWVKGKRIGVSEDLTHIYVYSGSSWLELTLTKVTGNVYKAVPTTDIYGIRLPVGGGEKVEYDFVVVTYPTSLSPHLTELERSRSRILIVKPRVMSDYMRDFGSMSDVLRLSGLISDDERVLFRDFMENQEVLFLVTKQSAFVGLIVSMELEHLTTLWRVTLEWKRGRVI